MPQLFITDLRALRRPLLIEGAPQALPPSMIDAVERAGVADDIPFILGDDGTYDLDLNRFFRACPTMGVRTPNSLKSYARDILTWLRFLAERRGGKTPWQVDREDVAAFRAARRRSPPPHRISAASWNRCIAALEKLYGWAQEEALVAATPFSCRRVWRHPQGSARGGPVAVAHNRARATVQAMAQRIQVLTLLAQEQDRRIAVLHDELARSGVVVPLGRGDAV